MLKGRKKKKRGGEKKNRGRKRGNARLLPLISLHFSELHGLLSGGKKRAGKEEGKEGSWGRSTFRQQERPGGEKGRKRKGNNSDTDQHAEGELEKKKGGLKKKGGGKDSARRASCQAPTKKGKRGERKEKGKEDHSAFHHYHLL